MLEGERFDAIAYGIQRSAEETLVSWIKNGIEQTGIRNIVMSGGVAQNIKANKLIIEQTGLSTLFIPPGPGDESLSVGVAFMEMLKHTPKHREPFQQPNAYFSLSFDEKIDAAIRQQNQKGWNATPTSNDEVANLLADGHVVARFSTDNMEFGARALGNRVYTGGST